ncbi:MAG: hypothetical protein OET44_01650 [Gammaproteobacteria bacterium]|nr:hypothetical protein [Gammaproteobacteria bacterium]
MDNPLQFGGAGHFDVLVFHTVNRTICHAATTGCPSRDELQ